jgi:hypothetical protein
MKPDASVMHLGPTLVVEPTAFYTRAQIPRHECSCASPGGDRIVEELCFANAREKARPRMGTWIFPAPDAACHGALRRHALRLDRA